ncbi:MAG: zf-TFIIB domain-containing protein [Armatimonadetes bacterium]|nr:zf-TFIIB domain-containing protein [Armatimonadota bacterium]MDW8027077.1 zf-TFIIB domain-containing protein [Armatimonadota bacterium]
MLKRVMVCPKCHVPLIHEKKGSLEADVCLQCGGMLLSMEVWKLIREDWESALALENTYEDNNPMPVLALEMLCPNCKIPMEQFFPKEAPNLPVEICVQCGSLWFDDGELGKLVEVIRSNSKPMTEPIEGEVQTISWVYCSHCGRENFSDSEKCWACGEILIPEQPPLPKPLQTAAEVLSMMVGGAGAILFGFFVTKPQSDKWAAFGLLMLIIGLLGLAVLRRLWRRGRGTPLFPTYSGH